MAAVCYPVRNTADSRPGDRVSVRRGQDRALPRVRASTSAPLRDLALLAAALLTGLAWSWPLLDPRYLPLHDTLFLAESFHTIYSHLAEYHGFPYWSPSVDYGVPSTIQFLSVMAPSRSAMAAIGLLFDLRDALLLLKIAFLLDQAILTIGAWLLARELFREPGAILLTTLAAAFIGQPWLLQQQFNLGIVWALPMQLFLVVRGCRLHQVGYLLAAIALAPFGHYWIGLHLLIQFIVFLFARRAWAWPWRAILVIDRGRLAGMALLLAWAAVYGGFYWHISSTAQFLHGQEGRVGPFVPLGEFLTYGGEMIAQPRWLRLLGGPMDATHLKVVGYAGWLPLAALVYAAFTVRDRLFFGFGLATLATLGISAGGAVAALSYLFPGMVLARHLGHLGGVIQVMLVLTAGFGFERLLRVAGLAARRRALWTRVRSLLARRLSWGIAAAVTLYALDAVGAYMVHTDVLPLAGGPHHARWAWPIAFAVRLAAYGMLGVWVWHRLRGPAPPRRLTLTCALGVALMLDLGPFHALERWLHPVLGVEQQQRIAELFATHPLAFQAQRQVLTREQADQQKYFGLSILDGGALSAAEDVRNAIHHATLGLEGCQNAWDALLISRNVAVLLEAMGLGAREHPDFTLPFNDLSEEDKRILGCGRPKLRLLGFARGRLVQSPEQAIDAFLARDGTPQVVLRTAADSRLLPLADDPAARALVPPPPADALTGQLQAFREDRFFEQRIDTPFVLDLSFQRPFLARSYRMQCGVFGADSWDRMPVGWRLLGSEDGTTWHEIARVSDAPAWRNTERRQYPIDDPAAFAHYRLVVDRLAGGDVLRLNQFALSPLPVPASPPVPLEDASIPAGDIAVPTRFDANLLEAEVTVADPEGAWLVYADAFNPYWTARLDGAPTEVFEADLGVKAVQVPAGRHTVTFAYDDPIARWLYWGLAGFPGLFLLALGWLWWRGGRAGARRRHPARSLPALP